MYQHTAGQVLRTQAQKIREERRYFATPQGIIFPYIDTTYWSHESLIGGRTYNPDAVPEPWVEITGLVNDDQTKLRMTDPGFISKWEVQLAGIGFDSRYLNPDQGVLCLRRLWPDVETYGGWSFWRLWWLGYFKQGSIQHDWRDAGEWSATVEGVGQYLDKVRARAETFGTTNLALGMTPVTSPLLEDVTLEAGRGEFLGTLNNQAENLTDEDLATPTIWANAPASQPERFAVNYQGNSPVKINEIFLQSPVGVGRGTPEDGQWIEMVNIHSTVAYELSRTGVDVWDHSGNYLGGFVLNGTTAKGPGWTPSGAGLAQQMGAFETTNIVITGGAQLQGRTRIRIGSEEMTVLSYSPGNMSVDRPNNQAGQVHASGASIDVPGDVENPATNQLSPYDFVLAVKNRRRFDEQFEAGPGTLVVDWSDANRNLTLDPLGGWIKVTLHGVIGSEGIEVVRYGSAGAVDGWNGDAFPVPSPGRSFKRKIVGGGEGPNNWDTDSAADWIVEDVPTPGRRLLAIGDDGRRNILDTAWFSLPLPSLGVELTEALEVGGTTLRVNHTGGFYQNKEKEVLLAGVVYPYASKTRDTIVLSTPYAGDSALPAGTGIYPVSPDHVAHDSWPIRSFGWTRKQLPVPAIYTVYVSSLEDPILPDASGWHENWQEDWTQITTVQDTLTVHFTRAVENWDQFLQVDTTAGWPGGGWVFVRHPLYNWQGQESGEWVVDTVRYVSKTQNRINLSEPWYGGEIKEASLSGATAAALVSSGLSRTHELVPVRRARHLLMITDSMSDLGRKKLNSIVVYPDVLATQDPGRQVDSLDIAEVVRYMLVERFRMPASKVTAISHTIVPSISSMEAEYSRILADWAEATASHLRLIPAEGARWRPAPELGSVTDEDEVDDEIDWTIRTDQYVRLAATRSPRNTVSQVQLRYRVSGSEEVRLVAYPNSSEFQQMNVDPNRGKTWTYPKTLTVPSDSAAMKIARLNYNKRAYPVRVTVRFPYPTSDWLYPLAIVRLEVDVDHAPAGTTPAINGRYKCISLEEGRSGSGQQRSSYSEATLERLGA